MTRFEVGIGLLVSTGAIGLGAQLVGLISSMTFIVAFLPIAVFLWWWSVQ